LQQVLARSYRNLQKHLIPSCYPRTADVSGVLFIPHCVCRLLQDPPLSDCVTISTVYRSWPLGSSSAVTVCCVLLYGSVLNQSALVNANVAHHEPAGPFGPYTPLSKAFAKVFARLLDSTCLHPLCHNDAPSSCLVGRRKRAPMWESSRPRPHVHIGPRWLCHAMSGREEVTTKAPSRSPQRHQEVTLDDTWSHVTFHY
jgi:hypothetical protein